jgi:hypothetical protein
MNYESSVLLPSALADGSEGNNNLYRALAPSPAGAKALKNERSVFYRQLKQTAIKNKNGAKRDSRHKPPS